MNYPTTINNTDKSLTISTLIKDPTFYREEIRKQTIFIDDVILKRREFLINLIHMNNSVSDSINNKKSIMHNELTMKLANLIEGHRVQSIEILNSYKALLGDIASNNKIDLNGKAASIPDELKNILNNYAGSDENMINLRISEYIISDISKLSGSLVEYLDDYSLREGILNNIKLKITKAMKEEAERIKKLLDFRNQLQAMAEVLDGALVIDNLKSIKEMIESMMNNYHNLIKLYEESN